MPVDFQSGCRIITCVETTNTNRETTMATQAKIVTVWLDETSDEHGWIVDTDTEEGGQSRTIEAFPPTAAGRKKAIAAGKREAKKRGVELQIRD
jgi:hypothetical protein